MQDILLLVQQLGELIRLYNGQAVLTVVSFGMGLSFLLADPKAPTSKYLALFFFGIGLSIAMNSSFYSIYKLDIVPRWTGISGIADTIAAIAGFEWILRIRNTLPTKGLDTRFGNSMIRVAQLLMLFYMVMGFIYPTIKAHHFFGALASVNESMLQKGFWLFAVPMESALTLGGLSVLLVLRRKPEIQESIRLVAFILAVPFLASGLILPEHLAPISSAIGMMIFLIGAVQYHIHQGRRGLFMSRFLSPQVVNMVNENGLSGALKDQHQEISVLCCDLRGFTAFSEASSSQQVIQVLREYYDVVGGIVAEHGGTIKDYAGDGVLILVGAPLAYADHAERALKIGQDIITQIEPLLPQWSQQHAQLGISAGIASGTVTVGVIGGAGRLEYAAVGSAVNLASRLCENAKASQILVADRTRELLDSRGERLNQKAGLSLKGFGDNVPNWAV